MAPKRAYDLGCETFQCFTRSPQGGPAPVLTQSVIANFQSQMRECGIETFYIHTPYYINFASLEPRIRHSSIKVVREELERGSVLGARYVMTHLGSRTGQTIKEGIVKVADSVKQILDPERDREGTQRTSVSYGMNGYQGTTELLLEIAAGTGNIIGDTFEEIAEILNQVKNMPGFGGICFDTCHAFASGYDFQTTEGARNVLEEFEKKIGLEYLKLTHVNDSMVGLGGKRDRHEHIGDGFIGVDGIASLLKTPPFQKIDWLLETEDSKREEDIRILKNIRSAA